MKYNAHTTKEHESLEPSIIYTIHNIYIILLYYIELFSLSSNFHQLDRYFFSHYNTNKLNTGFSCPGLFIEHGGTEAKSILISLN